MLCPSYRVPFYHFPPVSLEPRELSSCSLGSARVLALREEVDKMIQKDALEIVDRSGLEWNRIQVLYVIWAKGPALGRVRSFSADRRREKRSKIRARRKHPRDDNGLDIEGVARPGLLQLSLPRGEGDWGMEARH